MPTGFKVACPMPRNANAAGSAASTINLVLGSSPKTLAEIVTQSGCSYPRVRAHLKAMLDKGVVIEEAFIASEEATASDYQNAIALLTQQNQELTTAKERLERKTAELEEQGQGAKVIVIKHPKGKAVEMEGMVHKQFERILKLAQARKNIFLAGPTGSGKTHVCSQIAKALKLPFYFISCTAGMSEGQLGGRLLPIEANGSFGYVPADFIRAYENGGVFLLDEMDAADSNVLLMINAALANGKVAVPNRPDAPYAERHADFVCIAAANTLGTGADRMYSGRNQLDAATLDRFQIGKVFIDYDKRVERELCPNDELLSVCHRIREAISAHRLERAMSTRFIKDAYEMVQDWDWEISDVLESYFLGWREDEVMKVKNHAGIR